jgi:hypothetical protein
MNVVECITEPDVAVTVTVDDVDVVELLLVGVPVVELVVPVLLQPANSVSAIAVSGSNISSWPADRRRRRTKNSPRPSGEPASSNPVRARTTAAALAVAELMVRVELIEPAEDTATVEKLHVAPAGRPVHVNVTAELVEKLFCGSRVTVAVAVPPEATVTAVGATDSRKSGIGEPVAGTMALAWFEGDELPLESTAVTT